MRRSEVWGGEEEKWGTVEENECGTEERRASEVRGSGARQNAHSEADFIK